MSSSPPPSVVTSVEAYAKALLHAQKYATQAVAGFLIGKRITESGAADSVFIADAVPLFHTIMMTHPHPMLDVAYAQVSSYARTKGMVMLGYYVANEHANNSSVSPLTTNILRMLQDKVSTGHHPLLWTIVAANSTERADVSVAYYQGNDVYAPAPALTFGRWNSDTLSCEPTESNAAALEVFRNAMDALKQFQLVDFEDHLEAVQLNYLEQAVPV
ncbi:hypothetical protein DQ04_08141010 [Trypanosoma grayi]|uniref:hypothetical protein n=1 Tax=Trypanosoma grayi TaxID=71804 RepID=UPI0004F42D18|nr:hypothetical protein DQ04_08141010 [Trypanosoma grayi]KEG08046.1 hypothetical protein DQ04_08141010 [Trypanosoma grayi]